jgi:type IV pilus assembly protein PilY1
MKNTNNVGNGRRMRVPVWLVAACMAGSPLAALAVDAPAQKPLTSRDGGSTKPNVVLTLDESGSMAFQYLPEGTFKVAGYSVKFPSSYTIVMHPSDPRQGNGGSLVGIVQARADKDELLFSKQMRSPDLNKQYYNPAIRYLPWINADGTRMANASFTGVKFDPLGIKTAATADLSVIASKQSPGAANSGAEWCTVMPSNSTTPTCSDSNKLPFNPAIFYLLKVNAGGAFLDPNGVDNYKLYDLNGSASTYPWGKDSVPNRTDCDAATCSAAAEKQNFANWFQYHRSRILAAQAGVPEAFQAFSDKQLRVGWGDIKKGTTKVDGVNTDIVSQGVRDFTSTHKSDMFTWVRSIDVSGGTPLRTAMYGVGKYFERKDDRGPYSDNPATGVTGAHKTCRRNYNVFITDGYWNDAGDDINGVGNSDNTDGAVIPPNGYQYLRTRPYRDSNAKTMLADIAMHFWKRDLRPDLDNKLLPTADNPAYWQHMVNFTVGFGVKGTLDPATDLPALTNGDKAWGADEIDDLWHAALNSRGQYFSASNATELASAIRTSLNDAVERELKEAGVAAAATVLEDGNRKYIPKYKTGVWTGDVDAYVLDAKGQAGAKQWSASQRMPVWDQRNIVTWDAFRTVTGVITPAGVNFDWNALSTPAKTEVTKGTKTLFDFIRGDRSNEGTLTGKYRQRESILGDIVNSTPVFAKDGIVEPYSKLPNVGGSYGKFLTDKSARTGVLYVGGNDGMLHAFQDSKGATTASTLTDGKEIFAYVPRASFPALTKLTDLDYGLSADNYHRFFVDGPLSERDAYVKAPGAASASWRNYLFGTMGAGGRAVFALDITDPTALNASAVRWEISSADHPELGYITSPIEVGVVDDGSTNGKWVAVFGNGYVDSASAKANLFIVGIQDGSVTKLEVSSAAGNGLGGVTLKRNSFGQIDYLYAGDLLGNLWKISWNATDKKFEVGNSGKALFTAPSNQPIVQPPALVANSDGDWVVFGTGRLLTVADADSTQLQSLYGLRVKTSMPVGTTFKTSDLVPRTIDVVMGTGKDAASKYFDLNGEDVDWSSPTNTWKGWVVDLTITDYKGLRVSYAPQTIADELVFFSLIAPAQNVQECDQATGRGVNLIFPIETGQSAKQCILDTNGDGVIGDGPNGAKDNCDVAGYTTSADGIDAVLRGKTTTTCKDGTCEDATEYSVQNTTGGRNLLYRKKKPDPSVVPTTAKDRVWRRIVNPPIR